LPKGRLAEEITLSQDGKDFSLTDLLVSLQNLDFTLFDDAEKSSRFSFAAG